MTQDRRKDNQPRPQVEWTDTKLIAAGLAHLEAEGAAACLVRAKDDVWVGVGTKGALRGLLSDDAASQSQAVPSELASAAQAIYDEQRAACLTSPILALNEMARDNEESLVSSRLLVNLFEALFSHSAATEKARPTDDHLWDETIRDRDTYHEWADKLAEAISKHFGAYIGEHSNTNCPWAEALEAIENTSPAAPLAAAVPAEEASDYDLKAEQEYFDRWPDTSAEPAPIQASAELPEAEILGALEAITHEVPKRLPPGWLKFAREIEKRVLAHLSKPTAQGTAQSIDTDDFRELMCNLGYWAEEDEGDRDHCAKSLIEFIDRHIADQATADRDAIRAEALEEAAKLADTECEAARGRFNIGQEWSAGTIAKNIRALKGAAVEGEQNEGGAK